MTEEQRGAEAVQLLAERHEALSQRVDGVSEKVDENTKITISISEVTHRNAESLDRLESKFGGFEESLELLRSGIIMLGRIGSFGRWITAKSVTLARLLLPLATLWAIVSAWFSHKGGKLPP